MLMPKRERKCLIISNFTLLLVVFKRHHDSGRVKCICDVLIPELNSASKTVILKDGSVRSTWTYLTASPCYTTNTNKHDYTTNMYVSKNKQ